MLVKVEYKLYNRFQEGQKEEVLLYVSYESERLIVVGQNEECGLKVLESWYERDQKSVEEKCNTSKYTKGEPK